MFNVALMRYSIFFLMLIYFSLIPYSGATQISAEQPRVVAEQDSKKWFESSNQDATMAILLSLILKAGMVYGVIKSDTNPEWEKMEFTALFVGILQGTANFAAIRVRNITSENILGCISSVFYFFSMLPAKVIMLNNGFLFRRIPMDKLMDNSIVFSRATSSIGVLFCIANMVKVSLSS